MTRSQMELCLAALFAAGLLSQQTCLLADIHNGDFYMGQAGWVAEASSQLSWSLEDMPASVSAAYFVDDGDSVYAPVAWFYSGEEGRAVLWENPLYDAADESSVGIKQPFTSSGAITTLSFSYVFDARSSWNSGIPAESDHLWVHLLDPGGDMLFSKKVATTAGKSADMYFEEGTKSYDLPTPLAPNTEYWLAFELLGEYDQYKTLVEIDDVRCYVVPVPGAALIGGIGLSFAGWRLRRRRNRKIR